MENMTIDCAPSPSRWEMSDELSSVLVSAAKYGGESARRLDDAFAQTYQRIGEMIQRGHSEGNAGWLHGEAEGLPVSYLRDGNATFIMQAKQVSAEMAEKLSLKDASINRVIHVRIDGGAGLTIVQHFVIGIPVTLASIIIERLLKAAARIVMDKLILMIRRCFSAGGARVAPEEIELLIRRPQQVVVGPRGGGVDPRLGPIDHAEFDLVEFDINVSTRYMSAIGYIESALRWTAYFGFLIIIGIAITKVLELLLKQYSLSITVVNFTALDLKPEIVKTYNLADKQTTEGSLLSAVQEAGSAPQNSPVPGFTLLSPAVSVASYQLVADSTLLKGIGVALRIQNVSAAPNDIENITTVFQIGRWTANRLAISFNEKDPATLFDSSDRQQSALRQEMSKGDYTAVVSYDALAGAQGDHYSALVLIEDTKKFTDFEHVVSALSRGLFTNVSVRWGDVIDNIQLVKSGKSNSIDVGGKSGSQSRTASISGRINKVSGFKGTWYGKECLCEISFFTTTGQTETFGSRAAIANPTSFEFLAPSGEQLVDFSGETLAVSLSDNSMTAVVSSVAPKFGK